ncbi:MAG: ABC transporter ATP-binding protein [Rhizobiaceae bacterium]
MGSLSLTSVHKSFGEVKVLNDINLEVKDGEFVVFVGPSGCGKSTLLRIIAGLETASAGTVQINGTVVNAQSPTERGIAMVFQTYALYPHLTVRDNMQLGLKQAKLPKAEIGERVDKATAMLSLEDYLDRRPAELSGGQRQRVAIGRAVVRYPTLFLFDEPLSNLDAELRVNTRLEFARLHRELETTMIYVTHDQTEAMTLADRIVVLRDGQIEQIGAPMELYNSPANVFVAGFIGSPKMNLISSRDVGSSRAAQIGVRPEHLIIDRKRGDWKGTVTHVEHLGVDTNIYLDCESAGLLTVRLFGEQSFEAGETVYATPVEDRVIEFGDDGEVLK